ncbi:MAG: aldose 1-epimerase family protein [Clostridia bacterium]|nr:aldose 1-epimerase family protein [Clostridia bacterium]
MLLLENGRLRVRLSETGGELQSLFSKDTGTEYLWQGDPAWWAKRAPNLFPFIGRLFEKRYTLHGKSYDMPIHGFLPRSEMEVEEASGNSCTLLLRDSEETRACYPFRFEYRLRYTLDESCLSVRCEAVNRSDETMFFCEGAHPGFNVPLEPGLKFEDYNLTFREASMPALVDFSPTVLVSGVRTRYPLKDNITLPLRHELFDRDAVVLADAPRGVTLSSPEGRRGVRVSWPQMAYIGFWHKSRSEAPYVCIEPWSALPGREGIVEDLEEMAGMTALDPGAVHINSWKIEVW